MRQVLLSRVLEVRAAARTQGLSGTCDILDEIIDYLLRGCFSSLGRDNSSCEAHDGCAEAPGRNDSGP